jgi:serralysin
MVDIPDDTTTTAALEFDSGATVGTYSGYADYGGDHDWIRVSLTAGVTYNFYLSVQNNGGDNGDSLLSLRNATGIEIASNDNVGVANSNSFVQFIPATSGTYYIDASFRLSSQRGA